MIPSAIFAEVIRLQQQMTNLASVTAMSEDDTRVSEIIAAERSRLRAFIRRRVPTTV
jgi:hypothetical protein